MIMRKIYFKFIAKFIIFTKKQRFDKLLKTFNHLAEVGILNSIDKFETI